MQVGSERRIAARARVQLCIHVCIVVAAAEQDG